jgi:2-polyprenyl-6-methoxyphenol hydroxylase-like FAD-dependent oxidoreductase
VSGDETGPLKTRDRIITERALNLALPVPAFSTTHLVDIESRHSLNMAVDQKPWAVIVGAGPSGLLLALMLAKRNVPVVVLEGSPVLDDSPRAAYYGPPAVFELDRAGVLEEIRAQGFDPIITCWRKLDGTYLAGWDCSVVKDDYDRLACMPLAQLDQLLYRHAVAQPNVKVLFNHKVIDIGQDDDKAWVDADTPDGVKRFEGQYVVGCDGASSTVRKKMFGDKDFPGWTWDKQIVATNVRSVRKSWYPANRPG